MKIDITFKTKKGNKNPRKINYKQVIVPKEMQSLCPKYIETWQKAQAATYAIINNVIEKLNDSTNSILNQIDDELEVLIKNGKDISPDHYFRFYGYAKIRGSNIHRLLEYKILNLIKHQDKKEKQDEILNTAEEMLEDARVSWDYIFDKVFQEKKKDLFKNLSLGVDEYPFSIKWNGEIPISFMENVATAQRNINERFYKKIKTPFLFNGYSLAYCGSLSYNALELIYNTCKENQELSIDEVVFIYRNHYRCRNSSMLGGCPNMQEIIFALGYFKIDCYKAFELSAQFSELQLHCPNIAGNRKIAKKLISLSKLNNNKFFRFQCMMRIIIDTKFNLYSNRMKFNKNDSQFATKVQDRFRELFKEEYPTECEFFFEGVWDINNITADCKKIITDFAIKELSTWKNGTSKLMKFMLEIPKNKIAELFLDPQYAWSYMNIINRKTIKDLFDTKKTKNPSLHYGPRFYSTNLFDEIYPGKVSSKVLNYLFSTLSKSISHSKYTYAEDANLRSNIYAFLSLSSIFNKPKELQALLKKSGMTIHDLGQCALLKDLTPEEKKVWKQLATKNLKVLKFNDIARKIIDFFVKNDKEFNEKIKLKEIEDASLQCFYPNIKCKEVAKLAGKFNLSTYSFTQVQSFVLNNEKKTAESIPFIEINGEEVGLSKNWKLRKIDYDDPRVLFAGNFTNCCQHFFGAAHECAKHSYKSEYSGVYEVTYKGEMMSCSWAWISRDGTKLMFDSIEAKSDEIEEKVFDLWLLAAERLVGKLCIEQVLLADTSYGIGDAITEKYDFEETSEQIKMMDISYRGYSDYHGIAYILAE